MTRPLVLASAACIVSLAVFTVGLERIADSSSSRVTFPSSVAAVAPNPSRVPVPVHLAAGRLGETQTASLRGGQATATSTNGDAGQVGYRRTSRGQSSSTVRSTAPPAASPAAPQVKPKKPKKRAQRQISIGATSGPNSDQGLATGAR